MVAGDGAQTPRSGPKIEGAGWLHNPHSPPFKRGIHRAQRWEIEVCHRELKASFGLGDKQCWNPYAAVASVQWTAWVYSLLLLAGYRTWGLCRHNTVPTLCMSRVPRSTSNLITFNNSTSIP